MLIKIYVAADNWRNTGETIYTQLLASPLIVFSCKKLSNSIGPGIARAARRHAHARTTATDLSDYLLFLFLLRFLSISHFPAISFLYTPSVIYSFGFSLLFLIIFLLLLFFSFLFFFFWILFRFFSSSEECRKPVRHFGTVHAKMGKGKWHSPLYIVYMYCYTGVYTALI